MDERTRARIGSIKQAIAAMLRERERLHSPGGAVASPSAYWSSFCARFAYMLGLPEEAFEQIRVHTYHLTGDNYQTYVFGDSEAFLRERELLVRGIPHEYWLYEPAGGIGFPCDDGLVSYDTNRFQAVVNTLYREGILASANGSSERRRTALEIGGGYGGLAHHLSRLAKLTYVIVDLPETLLFSASYLAMLNPERTAYLYSPDTFDEFLAGDPSRYDFVFVPNYRLEDLRRMRFDLVVNVASFQEMRVDQVESYLDFIAATCAGAFLSWNQDVQPMNHEALNVSQLLLSRFAAREVTVSTQLGGFSTRLLHALKTHDYQAPTREQLRALAGRVLRSAAYRIDRPPVERPYRQFFYRAV